MKFPGGGGGMGQLMAQAQKMQSEMKKLQEQLAREEMDVESAGGRIKIRINGKQEILNISLAKDIIDPADPEMLADLIKVAINDAVQSSQKRVANEMSRIIPPGMAGLF